MRTPLQFAWATKARKGFVHIVNGLQTYCILKPNILQHLDNVSERYPAGKKMCGGCKRKRMGLDISLSKLSYENGDLIIGDDAAKNIRPQ